MVLTFLGSVLQAGWALLIDRSERQVRAAVRVLEARGLVVVEHGHTGWRGRGEYGRLVPRRSGVRAWRGDEERLTVTMPEGSPTLYSTRWVHTRDVEYLRQGVPSSGLRVWLTERHREHEERLAPAVLRDATEFGRLGG